MDTDVAVVGGGLAGLVAASRLGEADRDVTLVERRPKVGGRVRSREVDGFTLDRGFQVLFTAYPAVQTELDLDALDLRSFAPGATICRPGSRAVLSDPLREPTAAVESLFNREVPFSDKLRTLALRYDLGSRDDSEFFVGPDQSIRSYLDDWGFSDAYVENFLAPFYGGITLDRELGTSKQVFEYTFRSMSRGRIAVPADGMAAIPAQLARRAERAGVDLRTDTEVNGVDRDGEGVTVRTESGALEAGAAVIAASPPEARRLSGVGSIPTEGIGCVSQWYTLPEGTPFETGRRILLNAGDPSPNTVVPMSDVAPEYAPDDRALVNATFVGDAAFDRGDGALAAETRDRLNAWYSERLFDGLELLGTDRIRFAQFAQPPGAHDGLPAVDAPDGPVFLAGEYTEWSSIQGAFESGRRAAAAARAGL